MKKLIWISSYPKCGNTYIRCFLSHYLFNRDSNFSFDAINNIPKFETKKVFSKVLKDKILNDTNFTYYKHSIQVQKDLIKKYNQKNLIFKTHHFFGQINNFHFTNKDTTLLFIYIIRDPREVLVSYSKHSGMSFDQMMEFYVSDNTLRKYKMESIINWSLHYKSWKSFKSVPSIFIRFEDLVKNPKKIFQEILKFLSQHIKIDLDEDIFLKTIKFTQFNNLQKLEKKFGFEETKQNKFFNSGKIDSWKKILPRKTVKIIENKFKEEMIELGYL